MSLDVRVQAEPWNATFAVYVMQRNHAGPDLLRVPTGGGFEWSEVPHGERPPEPTYRIEEDVARLLFDALSREYGLPTDVQHLRWDYDDERARVDKLLHVLAACAVGPHTGSAASLERGLPPFETR